MRLSGWVVLRADAVDGDAPTCRTPSDVTGWELRRWFHDRGALCQASLLQSRLQELLRLSLALAWDDPKAGLNASVSFVAASHFRYALAAETSLDPDLLVGRFVDLLRGVYGRKFPGQSDIYQTPSRNRTVRYLCRRSRSFLQMSRRGGTQLKMTKIFFKFRNLNVITFYS